jgi:hypothetical protein
MSSPTRRYFHGTDKWREILASGFKMEGTGKHDPGDFGYGIYFSPRLTVARCHGRVLKVRIDVSEFAHVPNPYFLESGKNVKPETEVEQLFHLITFHGNNMETVRGERRERTARAVRDTFLAKGFKGICTSHHGGEVVVFDTRAIQSIEPYSL